MRYLVSMAYDGSKFYGFQKQQGKKTVQGDIEIALSKIDKNKCVIKGAGRTDRGVHAYNQRCHFDLLNNIPPNRLKKALNDLTNDYIIINDCKIVENSFHSRFKVIEKEYMYKINIGEFDPLKTDYYWQISEKLDIDKMKQCAKIFIGVHNFRSFISGNRENYDAILFDINIRLQKDILEIKFRGKSFYRYMVRNLVGAIVSVGKGKTDIKNVQKILNEHHSEVELPTAPPNGLYLNKVKY